MIVRQSLWFNHHAMAGCVTVHWAPFPLQVPVALPANLCHNAFLNGTLANHVVNATVLSMKICNLDRL